ncbi:MAG: hypothetical protein M3Q81_05415 [bacterium]|nr:hypothetical protein [bacterium]
MAAPEVLLVDGQGDQVVVTGSRIDYRRNQLIVFITKDWFTLSKELKEKARAEGVRRMKYCSSMRRDDRFFVFRRSRRG